MNNLLNNIAIQILNPLIGFLISVAFLVFIWGIVELIYGSDNEEKVKIGKRHLVYGLIGLFIMLAVLGIMNVTQNFINSL
ncbi:MAG: hypothetical protein AAB491_00850 [Patescibacteria group bacterium]